MIRFASARFPQQIRRGPHCRLHSGEHTTTEAERDPATEYNVRGQSNPDGSSRADLYARDGFYGHPWSKEALTVWPLIMEQFRRDQTSPRTEIPIGTEPRKSNISTAPLCGEMTAKGYGHTYDDPDMVGDELKPIPRTFCSSLAYNTLVTVHPFVRIVQLSPLGHAETQRSGGEGEG